MVKEVIVLRGVADVGKSQTIIKVFDLLKSKHKNVTIEFENLFKRDITVVLTINGVKIGIESQGDPGGRLKKSLSLFVKKFKCLLIVCATRTTGQTVDAVKELQQKYGYKVTWLEKLKSDVSKQHASNDAMAEMIDRAIEKSIAVNR